MHLATLFAALVLGAWGSAGCGPVGPAVAVSYEWRSHADDPAWLGLFRDGVQIAGYDCRRKVFRTYDAGRDAWGLPEPPPWEARPAVEAGRNFGVEQDRLNGAEHYSLNGRPATKEQIAQLLAAGRIPDDAGRGRLTVIGSPELCQKVLDDFTRAPALAEWKDKLIAKGYAPQHWAVARTGFYTAGQPTIYVQSADGTVLHRQDDYGDGAEGLAKALRRADPSYDHQKDKDLRVQFFPLRLDGVPPIGWLATLAALIVGILTLRRRGNHGS